MISFEGFQEGSEALTIYQHLGANLWTDSIGPLSPSDVLIITSLNGGAGVTEVSTLSGMASAKVQLIPLAKAADELHLDVRVLSLDIDKPSVLNQLGTPSLCFISKINHFKTARVDGFAMAVLSAVSRLKAIGTKIVILYCDNIASLSCSRGHLYRDLLRHADHVVVPSQEYVEKTGYSAFEYKYSYFSN